MKIVVLKTLAIISVLVLLSVVGSAAPGGLDPTFSGDGKLTDFFPGSGNDFAEEAALQPDGKLVVVGSDFRVCSVARFNTDGSLDNSFGDGGKLLIPRVDNNSTNQCKTIALQTDGKIILGGSAYIQNDVENSEMIVYRLNPNGSLDTSFGGTGKVVTVLSDFADGFNSLVIQADGKIIGAGFADVINSTTSTGNFAVVRYNADGSLDTTFDSDGKVITFINNSYSLANSVVIQPDGKIAVGGTTDTISSLGVGKFAVVRYTAGGSLDTSFGGTGIVITEFAGLDDLNEIALQTDGKIVAAGSYNAGDFGSFAFALARYNSDGSLDETFDGDGKVMTNIGSSGDGAEAVAIQPDGKIVAAGYRFRNGLDDSALIRYNPNGSVDTSFGTNGIAIHLNPNTFISGRTRSGGYNDVLLQPDGKIVGLTKYYVGDDLDFAVLRSNANGSLDTTFDADGIAYADIATGSARGRGVAHQPDGKIVAVGSAGGSSTNFFVARYNSDGSPDASFGTAGKVNTPILDRDDHAEAVAIQTDGKIVVGGYALSSSNSPVFAIVRYNTNGTLDSTFDSDGKLTLTDTSISGAKSVLIQPDGKIIIAGTATGGSNTDFFAARFNPNGSLDTAFGGTGKVRTPVLSSFDYANAAALQADGKIVVAGYTDAGSFNWDFAVIRYNTNGSLDTSFDTDGKATTPILGGEDQANAVVIQADGKIVLAGYAINGSDNREFALARFNANGSLDASFDADGKLTTQLSDNDSVARSVAVQTDGKIVAAGYVYNSSFESDFALARYYSNGSLNASYGTGGKSVFNFGNAGDDEEIDEISLDSSGRAVAVGYSGGLMAIARILGDGGVQPVGRTPFDFDGDGRADLGIFRPGEGNWYLNNSQSGFAGVKWGLSTDKLAPADYDGDGKTDVAVWRESEGNFYILNSSNNSVRVENFGLAGDVLTVGDWDGDGKADPSVHRAGAQSYFYYRGSMGNPAGNITYLPWGTSGDKPVRGDFDGDGKFDAAVFRSSNNAWYIRNSSDGAIRYDYWGLATDRFVPADYDGDAKTDLAVFRDGIWYIKQSSNNQPRYEIFGLASDALVPADYDGDGRADIAVFRNGVWYIRNSTSGITTAQFGISSDAAVPNAYIGQ